MEEDAQRSSGYLIPGGDQDQAGKGPNQLDLMGGNPAQGGVVKLGGF